MKFLSTFGLASQTLRMIAINSWRPQTSTPFQKPLLRLYSSSVLRDIEPTDIYAPLQSGNSLKPQFDLIIDTRTPDEYEEDHLPFAVSVPVLSNQERQIVGKLYHEEEMKGRTLGAQLVLQNIASHLTDNDAVSSLTHSQQRVLIYCWRGNQRSKAFATVIAELTKSPVWVLTGGYRGFRQFLLRDSEELLKRFELRVISGLTGSGKTALLEGLESKGHSILHLERIAKHRGSLLGRYSEEQPSQKAFDNLLWQDLRKIASQISQSTPPLLWLECESRVIGSRHISHFLWSRMTEARRVLIHVSRSERVRHIMREYEHLMEPESVLLECLDYLAKHHSASRIASWKTLAQSGNYADLVLQLLEHHYDPSYRASRKRIFTCEDVSRVVPVELNSLEENYLLTEGVNRVVTSSDGDTTRGEQCHG